MNKTDAVAVLRDLITLYDDSEVADVFGPHNSPCTTDAFDAVMMRVKDALAATERAAIQPSGVAVAWEYEYLSDGDNDYGQWKTVVTRYKEHTECGHHALRNVRAFVYAAHISEGSASAGVAGMPVEQDPKYGIRDNRLFNRASGEFIPADEPVFIFRARDVHAVNLLADYARDVSNESHAKAVWARAEDFKKFWNANPDRMKAPDTEPVAQQEAKAEPIKLSILEQDMGREMSAQELRAALDTATAAAIWLKEAKAEQVGCKWVGGTCSCTRAQAQRCEIVESRMPNRSPAAHQPASHTSEHTERVLGNGEAGELSEQQVVDALAENDPPTHVSRWRLLNGDPVTINLPELTRIVNSALARTAPASATSAPSDAVAWAFPDGLGRMARVRDGYADSSLLTVHATQTVDYSVPLYDHRPTAPAPRTSIGDDAEFHTSFYRAALAYANNRHDQGAKLAALASYIETRIDTIIKGGGNA